MGFILLYGVRDKGIAKYRCSLNNRSKRKITSPRRKSQCDSRGCGCTITFSKQDGSTYFKGGVEDMDTIEEKEQEIDLEIQDLGMTKQKLNVSIIRKWVIMFGIAGIQTEGLRRMSILL